MPFYNPGSPQMMANALAGDPQPVGYWASWGDKMDPGGHRYGSEETNDIGAVLRLMQQHRQEHPELPISLFSAPPFGPIHEP